MTTASPVHSEKWPLDVDDPRRFQPARRGRFSPVTEADLQREFDSAFDDIPGKRWPEDWSGYRQDRADRDMATIRRTRWETER